MFQVESGHVVARVLDVVRPRRPPGFESELKLVRGFDLRFLPTHAVLGPPVQRDANAVYFQAAQSVQALPDDRLVPPAQQPVGRRRVPEVMLSSAFPDEMP